ncbi:MAG: hypothetical protein JRJ47_13860 [Deltaproteobacteria bacterium]|nr:hypothetical protein [Deltaproteobacteria bacterium]
MNVPKLTIVISGSLLCHFERPVRRSTRGFYEGGSARPGALPVVSYQAGNPGLGQGEILSLLHVGTMKISPFGRNDRKRVEMTDKDRNDEKGVETTKNVGAGFIPARGRA